MKGKPRVIYGISAEHECANLAERLGVDSGYQVSGACGADRQGTNFTMRAYNPGESSSITGEKPMYVKILCCLIVAAVIALPAAAQPTSAAWMAAQSRPRQSMLPSLA